VEEELVKADAELAQRRRWETLFVVSSPMLDTKVEAAEQSIRTLQGPHAAHRA